MVSTHLFIRVFIQQTVFLLCASTCLGARVIMMSKTQYLLPVVVHTIVRKMNFNPIQPGLCKNTQLRNMVVC